MNQTPQVPEQRSALTPPALLALARQHGTPTFVYEQATLDRSVEALRAMVGADTGILYSVKANPNPVLLRRLHHLGCGMEVASAGELELALGCGVPPGRITFTGPGKRDAELALAVRSGLFSINVESGGELRRLAAICRQQGRRAAVSLRIHPATGTPGRARAWRGPTPFGIDGDSIDQHLALLDELEEVDCQGIHVHASSQIANSEALGELMESTVQLAFSLSERINLRSINLGGGIRAPFYADDAPLDTAPIGQALAQIRARYSRIARGEVALQVESGRALVGPCGYFLTTVVDVKHSQNHRFAVLDGGIHQHLNLSGAFRTLGRPVDVVVCREEQGQATRETELVGPLCTPIDRLGSRVPLPEDLSPGDVLAFRHAGAYAKYASPLTFLGHDWPAELLVTPEGAWPIARRVTLRELLQLQTAGLPAPSEEQGT
ncbi:MAG: hypothetical protein ACXU86_04320 [Archangium sp.]